MRNSAVNRWIWPGIRIGLGLVFLGAGLPKIFDPTAFAANLGNYKLLPEVTLLPLAYGVPILEILIGLCLVLGVFTAGAARLATLSAAVFGVFVISALARGLNIECGCFSGTSMVSWTHAAFDLMLILAGVHLCGRKSATRPRRGPIVQAAIILTGTLVLAALHGAASPSLVVPPTASSVTRTPLVFKPSYLHLGTVAQETESEGEVIYKNLGTETITIDKIETSCGCTAPKLSHKTLRPGQEGRLKVRFHPGNSRGESTQSVKLYTSGQSTPATLQVLANIDPVIAVTPGVIALQDVGDAAIVQLKANRPGLEFQVSGISTASSSFKIQTSSSNEAGQVSLKVIVQNPISTESSDNIIPITVSTNIGASAVLYVKVGETPAG